MRAFAVRSFGESASVLDLPVPTSDSEVLIRVRFAGVNPLDNNLLGRLTAASSYPFVVGTDFAGVAERVPAGTQGLQVGDRVFGMARTHGSYAEYTSVAPAAAMEPLARIPDGVADDQAAALPIPAVTALRTVDLLDVTGGQHVVVMGATGGVGGYAVQMAHSAAHMSSPPSAATPTRRVASGRMRCTTARPLTSSTRCGLIIPKASMPSLTWSMARTPSAETPRSSGPEDAWSRPSSQRTKPGSLSGGSLPTTMPPTRIP